MVENIMQVFIYRLLTKYLLLMLFQVWFKNRRAKYRKMRREEQQRMRRLQEDQSATSPTDIQKPTGATTPENNEADYEITSDEDGTLTSPLRATPSNSSPGSSGTPLILPHSTHRPTVLPPPPLTECHRSVPPHPGTVAASLAFLRHHQSDFPTTPGPVGDDSTDKQQQSSHKQAAFLPPSKSLIENHPSSSDSLKNLPNSDLEHQHANRQLLFLPKPTRTPLESHNNNYLLTQNQLTTRCPTASMIGQSQYPFQHHSSGEEDPRTQVLAPSPSKDRIKREYPDDEEDGDDERVKRRKLIHEHDQDTWNPVKMPSVYRYFWSILWRNLLQVTYKLTTVKVPSKYRYFWSILWRNLLQVSCKLTRVKVPLKYRYFWSILWRNVLQES